MRNLRLTLAGAVMLALAVGTAGIVVAQAEGVVPVGVIIEGTPTGSDDGQMTVELGDGFSKVYDRIIFEQWEATDPRLSGDMTLREMRHTYQTLGYRLDAAEHTLVNDEGDWVGIGTGISSQLGGAEYGNVYTMTLHGAGAYEGLTAFLTYAGEESGETHTLRGVIVADGMPPFPEPAE